MKKILIGLLAATVLAAGCGKDNILWPEFDPQGNGESGTIDEGNGTAPLPSSDDSDIADEVFARTISIVFSDASGATVSGDANGIVKVSGNQVTVDNRDFDETVKYLLSGTASDGSLKLYSNNRQALVLDGLSLTNPSGAAINNQGKKRCYVVVKGVNTLSDGASATYAATDGEDAKAVLFSEGQVLVSGSGSLGVNALNAQGKAAVTSDDYFYIDGTPVLTVKAGNKAGHGLRGKDYVRIAGGTLDVTTQAAMKKGISSDGFVLVEGGNTTVNVTGGVAYDSEDQEYSGSAGIKADNYFGMTGGSLTITNSGTGGKGIHAGNYEYYADNGSLNDSYISGGTLKITTSGKESNDVSSKAIKIGYKQGSGRSYQYGGNLVISGGSVVVSSACSEALEAKGKLTISGGELHVTSSADDAINSQGEMNITGGYVYAYSSGNDGIDTNCDMKISGGYVFAVTTRGTPEVALDANTEGGYKLYIYSGATVVAYGGLEGGYSSANTVYSISGTANAWNALYNGSQFIAAFKAPSNLSTFAVTATSLQSGYKGVSVGETTLCNGVWATSDISGGTAVSLGTYSGGGGPGGGGGYPGGPGRPW